MNRVSLILILIFFAVTVHSRAQKPSEIYRFSDEIQAAFKADTTPWLHYQTWATQFSLSGYQRQALLTWDMAGVRQPLLSTADTLRFGQLQASDAREYILQQAKNERILIINEAHHNAQHRAFTRSLLRGLYDAGYRYLGLEALWDEQINERGYPTLGSGYYIVEPEFGNLIYEALQMGYTLFGYEASEGKNGKEREIEQAENIRTFIDAHPDGKVLVHCGFSHVFEGSVPAWEKAMAGRLKEYTGIDPFTVNQERYTPKSKPENDPLYVQWLRDHKAPQVLIDSAGNVFRGMAEPWQTDVVVLHPRVDDVDGRPGWITTGKKRYEIPASKRASLPLLVLAYREGEPPELAVPADVLELNTPGTPAVLYLSAGKYSVLLLDKNHQVTEKINVVVQ